MGRQTNVFSKWQDWKPRYSRILRAFQRQVEAVYGIKVQSEPLGELAINIVNGAKSIGFDAYECDDITHAIKTILSHSPKPARILVCGSLYLAGDVLLANNL